MLFVGAALTPAVTQASRCGTRTRRCTLVERDVTQLRRAGTSIPPSPGRPCSVLPKASVVARAVCFKFCPRATKGRGCGASYSRCLFIEDRHLWVVGPFDSIVVRKHRLQSRGAIEEGVNNILLASASRIRVDVRSFARKMLAHVASIAGPGRSRWALSAPSATVDAKDRLCFRHDSIAACRLVRATRFISVPS